MNPTQGKEELKKEAKERDDLYEGMDWETCCHFIDRSYSLALTRAAEIVKKESKDWFSCGCDETLESIAKAIEAERDGKV